MANGICRIPVTARYIVEDGKAIRLSAEYEDIPAADIAAYIMQHVEPEKIFGKLEGDRN